jgi:hypothetical protein
MNIETISSEICVLAKDQKILIKTNKKKNEVDLALNSHHWEGHVDLYTT